MEAHDALALPRVGAQGEPELTQTRPAAGRNVQSRRARFRRLAVRTPSTSRQTQGPGRPSSLAKGPLPGTGATPSAACIPLPAIAGMDTYPLSVSGSLWSASANPSCFQGWQADPMAAAHGSQQTACRLRWLHLQRIIATRGHATTPSNHGQPTRTSPSLLVARSRLFSLAFLRARACGWLGRSAHSFSKAAGHVLALRL